jgi:hypothetical protein
VQIKMEDQRNHGNAPERTVFIKIDTECDSSFVITGRRTGFGCGSAATGILASETLLQSTGTPYVVSGCLNASLSSEMHSSPF